MGAGGFAQQEDENGQMFHERMLELGLCAPSTFGSPDSSQYTWSGPSGRPHRIDYVVVPAEWGLHARAQPVSHTLLHELRVGPQDPSADDSLAFSADSILDRANSCDDHFLVAMVLTLGARGAVKEVSWRPRVFHSDALADAERQAVSRQELAQLQPAEWSLSVDQHERRLTQEVRRAAENASGLPRRSGGARP